MSDDGNHNFSMKRGGRNSSLATGAATVSSLVFNNQISNTGGDSGNRDYCVYVIANEVSSCLTAELL
jgi:hypothetical protein